MVFGEIEINQSEYIISIMVMIQQVDQRTIVIYWHKVIVGLRISWSSAYCQIIGIIGDDYRKVSGRSICWKSYRRSIFNVEFLAMSICLFALTCTF